MDATRNSATSNYNLYFGSSAEKVFTTNHDELDLDESDIVWSCSDEAVVVSNSTSSDGKKPTFPFMKIPSSKTKKGSNKVIKNQPAVSYGTSLPVKVPDYWSRRILGHHQQQQKDGDDEDEDEKGRWVPPHEYLARTRGSSLSVHEGIGRTLKGRDMSQLRNAVWKQIGFED